MTRLHSCAKAAALMLVICNGIAAAQSQQPRPASAATAAPAPPPGNATSSSIVPPKVDRTGETLTDLAFSYAGGTVLDAAVPFLGQSIQILHNETWLIAGGRYVLWTNTLKFAVKGAKQQQPDAALQKLRALIDKPACILLVDSKGAKLPAAAKVSQSKNVMVLEWQPIGISDKSRSPKTLHLPWGQITLLDRMDLKIPSSKTTLSSC